MLVLDAVVAGAVAGIAALGLGAQAGAAIAVGTAAFVLAIVGFVVYAVIAINGYRAEMVVRFRTRPRRRQRRFRRVLAG